MAVPVEVGSVLPPGLAFPPGLEPPPGLAPPPGLGGDDDVSENHSPDHSAASAEEDPTVRIVNLPNHLMSKAMMEVTLEQANLDKYVVKFDAIPGVQRGEAIITFTCFDVAERCARHFNGRKWDASGILVSAEVLTPKVPPTAQPAFVFSATVPEFVPLKPFAFSSNVPEFIPGGMKKQDHKKRKQYRRSDSAATSTTGSDVSTHDATSSCDEK
jgi:hypothetical protein